MVLRFNEPYLKTQVTILSEITHTHKNDVRSKNVTLIIMAAELSTESYFADEMTHKTKKRSRHIFIIEKILSYLQTVLVLQNNSFGNRYIKENCCIHLALIVYNKLF